MVSGLASVATFFSAAAWLGATTSLTSFFLSSVVSGLASVATFFSAAGFLIASLPLTASVASGVADPAIISLV